MDKQIAVITGASGGIGAACLAQLAAAGFWTVGVDIETLSIADEHLTVDMASASCGEEISAGVGQRPVAVLVNNAAVGTDTMLLDASVESWDQTMAVNLRAPFLIARALQPLLVASGSGAIVNISSIHALASTPGVGAYATSKGGLIALTRAMALEWAPQVRANCLLPGAVDTPMIRYGLERSAQTVEELGQRHPLGRIASPSEIADVVRFLAVEATFMTGAALVVDGGVLSRLSSE